MTYPVIDFPMLCWGIFSVKGKFIALLEGDDSSLDVMEVEIEGSGPEAKSLITLSLWTKARPLSQVMAWSTCTQSYITRQ